MLDKTWAYRASNFFFPSWITAQETHPLYANNNDREFCICGRRRHNICANIWKVTNKENDAILPKYYYRCQHCKSFSAVNIHFPLEKYEKVPLEYISISELKWELNRARIRRIQTVHGNSLPTKPLLFDLGSGEGCFTACFLEAYPNGRAVAVEADTRLQDKFYSDPRITFVPHFIEDFLAEDSSLPAPNLVVLTDVLEHLIEPEEMLERIAARMERHSLAYIVVPNARTFGADPYHVPAGDVDWTHANITCQHIWMIEPKRLRHLIAKRFKILDESTEFETDLRRDSVYSSFVACKR